MTRAGRLPPRVALVHDWLTGMRGGEKVLEVLCELYPDAALFTLVHVPGHGVAGHRAARRREHRSLVQRCPGVGRSTGTCCPLFPAAVEQFDLDDFDLVISTSHCAAKSVVRPGRARHLCYCHTPMRYAWDQLRRLLRAGSGSGAPARRRCGRCWPGWPAGTRRRRGRVDRYLANSQYVARRIRAIL